MKPILQLIGPGLALDTTGVVWVWLSGQWHHHCICGARTLSIWRSGEGALSRCVMCVVAVPYLSPPEPAP